MDSFASMCLKILLVPSSRKEKMHLGLKRPAGILSTPLEKAWHGTLAFILSPKLFEYLNLFSHGKRSIIHSVIVSIYGPWVWPCVLVNETI